MNVQLKDVGEFRLIDRIAQLTAAVHPSVIKGIGDDAAVVKLDARQCLLITADILKEGIHFHSAYTTPFLLGKKCLSVNLSDIAAMGGIPLYYVVCISAPPTTPFAFIREFYRGMNHQARKFNVLLLGGDTTSSRDGLSISITLLGKAPGNQVLYRQGAQQGDLIYVTGHIGDSALGLLMLSKKRGTSKQNLLIRRHLDPVPRNAAGREIAKAGIAHSMIDISDGLTADLRHILRASRVGADIRCSSLPLSASYKKYCSAFSSDVLQPALCGGEDYELLFTVPPGCAKKVENLSKKCAVPMTCIGTITGKASRLKILDDRGREVAVRKEGYTHF